VLANVMGPIQRVALAALVALGLAGCGLTDYNVFSPSFWSLSPLTNADNDEAELGLAELAKGNYAKAESQFAKALKLNPKDVYALLGAGILYQNTGQATKAREMYEAILAIRPKDSERIVAWNSTQTRPVGEVASLNLALLETGQAVSGFTKPGSEGAAAAQAPAEPGKGTMVAGAPTSAPMLGRVAPPPPPAPRAQPAALAPPPPPPEAMGKFAGADANVVARFVTLKALRDQGLVTNEEFNARRQANIGALLPLTSPPPAAGLDRPVPPTDQVAGRLRAIGRALEMRALTVSQHASERSMILDALAPAAPVVVANPGPPPQGLMEAADSVRRLEQLRDTGLITSDEYARERKAIEMAMAPPPTAPRAAAPPPAAAEAAPATKASAGPQMAVHLASYRSRQQAERGWAQLKRAHAAILGKLKSEITEVNLGPGKGTFFRLKAGPMVDKAEAADVCAQLKRRRQFCEPAVMDAS
jgi:tetratricopeptide (TPR) repeat protein